MHIAPNVLCYIRTKLKYIVEASVTKLAAENAAQFLFNIITLNDRSSTM